MAADPARIDELYAEAMRLGDAARRWFDAGGAGAAARAALPGLARTAVATEGLNVTARLMEVVSWILRHQAELAGDGALASGPRSRSTLAIDVDATAVPDELAGEGRQIALASRALYVEVRDTDRAAGE